MNSKVKKAKSVVVPFALASIVSATLLGGCSSGSSDSAATGTLSLGLTDGPVENASEVSITVTEIQLKGAENKTITLETPQEINLLDYQGESQIMLFEDQTLAAGEYQWIRLYLDESASYIQFKDGPQHPLEIPSAAQSGLKLNSGFTIGAGSSNSFTIDFDLRKSVHQTGTGEYKLRPTLRLINNLQAGTLTGTVDESLINDIACINNGDNNDTGNVVYLFEGENADVQDLQGNELDALTTAIVSLNNDTSDYEFEIGFIPAGSYTAAFTCDAVLDLPDEDNSVQMSFSSAYNVGITAAETTALTIDN